MNVIQNENNIFFDVDDTLVIWAWDLGGVDSQEGLREARARCVPVVDPHDGSTVWLAPHEPHIKLLRKHAARGSNVIVWSQGGFAWAEAVIKALGLEDCVNQVMSKPQVYVDDLPIEGWLKDRIYMKPDHPWGSK